MALGIVINLILIQYTMALFFGVRNILIGSIARSAPNSLALLSLLIIIELLLYFLISYFFLSTSQGVR